MLDLPPGPPIPDGTIHLVDEHDRPACGEDVAVLYQLTEPWEELDARLRCARCARIAATRS